jgi:hypothetical protein
MYSAKRTVFKSINGVRQEVDMLWIVFVIVLILWALGLLTGYTFGGRHSCLAGDRHHRGTDPIFSRTKTIITIRASPDRTSYLGGIFS